MVFNSTFLVIKNIKILKYNFTKKGNSLLSWGKIFIIVACFLVFGIGCDKKNGNITPKELQGAVIILLDTVRADHLSCYGYNRKTSPNIDVLSEKGIQFNATVSNTPWTFPSIISLLTGEYPPKVLEQKSKKLKWSIVELFKKAGFSTAAFTEGGYVSRVFGMDMGFTIFEEAEGPVQLIAQHK